MNSTTKVAAISHEAIRLVSTVFEGETDETVMVALSLEQVTSLVFESISAGQEIGK